MVILLLFKSLISIVSCQKGPNRHAYAWPKEPFWQDTLDIRPGSKILTLGHLSTNSCWRQLWLHLALLLSLNGHTMGNWPIIPAIYNTQNIPFRSQLTDVYTMPCLLIQRPLWSHQCGGGLNQLNIIHLKGPGQSGNSIATCKIVYAAIVWLYINP